MNKTHCPPAPYSSQVFCLDGKERPLAWIWTDWIQGVDDLRDNCYHCLHRPWGSQISRRRATYMMPHYFEVGMRYMIRGDFCGLIVYLHYTWNIMVYFLIARRSVDANKRCTSPIYQQLENTKVCSMPILKQCHLLSDALKDSEVSGGGPENGAIFRL